MDHLSENDGWHNVCGKLDTRYSCIHSDRRVKFEGKDKEDNQENKCTRKYPSRMDLSMHSLQKRCKHSMTVLVFLMIPVGGIFQEEMHHRLDREKEEKLVVTKRISFCSIFATLVWKNNHFKH